MPFAVIDSSIATRSGFPNTDISHAILVTFATPTTRCTGPSPRLHEPVCAASSDACPALKADMLPFAVSVHTLLPVRRPCAHANRPQHSASPRTHLACPTVHVLCTSPVACVQAHVRPVSCAHLLRARSSSGRRSPPPTSPPPSSMPYLESATLDPQQGGVEGDEWESSPPQPIVRLELASSHSDADSDYDSLRRLPEPRYGSSPVATSPARQLRDDTGVLRSRPTAPGSSTGCVEALREQSREVKEGSTCAPVSHASSSGSQRPTSTSIARLMALHAVTHGGHHLIRCRLFLHSTLMLIAVTHSLHTILLRTIRPRIESSGEILHDPRSHNTQFESHRHVVFADTDVSSL